MPDVPQQRKNWEELRARAVAADAQLRNGPKEWPGRPSRQRLELFLAASPEVVLELLAEIDQLRTGAAP